MRHLVLATLLLATSAAWGQSDDRSARQSPHNFNITAGFNRGGFTFGFGYEHMMDGGLGLGGHLRLFEKEDDQSAVARSPGLTIIGATLGHHFYKKNWDLAFTPSFNIINIDSPYNDPDDTTTFGPGMSISLVWAITDRAGVGFDYSNYWVWLEEDWQGQTISDLSAKLRLSF